MSERKTNDIRNLVLVGEGGAGKTALAEAIARVATGRAAIAAGASLELTPEEREFGHSIFPKIHRFEAEGVSVNLIDTPGAPELVAPSIACLAATETVVVVIHAHRGIEPVTEQMMEIARVRRQPRVIVINGIDRPHLDLAGLIADIQKRFGPECIPINLPSQYGRGIEDCLLNSSGTSDLGSIATAHRRVLDQVVELDETLMERYLAGSELDYAALHATFERALDEAHVVPICFTSAREGVGIRELLSVIARHLPSPLEGNPRPFVSGQPGQEVPFAYANDPTRPLLGHVFRVTTDPVAGGKIALFRVHQGVAHTHRDVFIGHATRPIRLGRLLTVNGHHYKDVASVSAGDIGAVAKVEELRIGDVLHDDHALDSVHLLPPPFPLPRHEALLVPKARHDEPKLASLLRRFEEEDPAFRVLTSGDAHEFAVQCLGEFQLRVVLSRLQRAGLTVTTHTRMDAAVTAG